jgi:hypothetical protein
MSDPDEAVVIASELSRQLHAGVMPPDDAYAWVRILCELVRHQRESLGEEMPTREAAGR